MDHTLVKYDFLLGENEEVLNKRAERINQLLVNRMTEAYEDKALVDLSDDNEVDKSDNDHLTFHTRVYQGQARGYGHITQQYLNFGRTIGG